MMTATQTRYGSLAADAYFNPDDEAYVATSNAEAKDAAKHLLEICAKQWWGGNGPGSGYENAAALLLRQVADELGMLPGAAATRNSPRKPFKAGVARRVWDRDGWECKHCGTHRDLTVDHIVPVAKGGTNDFDNLQTLCGLCNNKKGDRE